MPAKSPDALERKRQYLRQYAHRLRTQRRHESRLPEYTEYRDTGCNLFEACLRCPFARCQFDEPRER